MLEARDITFGYGRRPLYEGFSQIGRASCRERV